MLRRVQRQLASARLEQLALGADDVAQVPVLEGGVGFLAHVVARDVDLEAAGGVLQGGEAGLAHHPLEHHAAGDADLDVFARPAARSSLRRGAASRSAAWWPGLKSLGKATPLPCRWASRRALSFSRRSAMSWFSSMDGAGGAGGFLSDIWMEGEGKRGTKPLILVFWRTRPCALDNSRHVFESRRPVPGPAAGQPAARAGARVRAGGGLRHLRPGRRGGADAHVAGLAGRRAGQRGAGLCAGTGLGGADAGTGGGHRTQGRPGSAGGRRRAGPVAAGVAPKRRRLAGQRTAAPDGARRG